MYTAMIYDHSIFHSDSFPRTPSACRPRSHVVVSSLGASHDIIIPILFHIGVRCLVSLRAVPSPRSVSHHVMFAPPPAVEW